MDGNFNGYYGPRHTPAKHHERNHHDGHHQCALEQLTRRVLAPVAPCLRSIITMHVAGGVRLCQGLIDGDLLMIVAPALGGGRLRLGVGKDFFEAVSEPASEEADGRPRCLKNGCDGIGLQG